MWSLTQPRAKRIGGPRTFRSSPIKDFFNTIGTKRTNRAGLLMSVIWVDRKWRFGAVRTVFDLGCVKTRTSREGAELFSLFSSFDSDCQSTSFLIQRNQERLSKRKSGVRVFTQPGPERTLTLAVLRPTRALMKQTAELPV
jgi:hypothetical protein